MRYCDFFLFLYDIADTRTIAKVVKRLNSINSMRIQNVIANSLSPHIAIY